MGGDTGGQKQIVALNEFAQNLKRFFTSIDIRLKCNLFVCTFFGVECLIDKFLGNFLGNVYDKFRKLYLVLATCTQQRHLLSVN